MSINFCQLPESLHILIASHLPLGARRNLGLCSRYFSKVFEDTTFWKQLRDRLLIREDASISYKFQVKNFYARFNLQVDPLATGKESIMMRYNLHVLKLKQSETLREETIKKALAPSFNADIAFHISQIGPISCAASRLFIDKLIAKFDYVSVNSRKHFHIMITELFKKNQMENYPLTRSLVYACAAGCLDSVNRLMQIMTSFFSNSDLISISEQDGRITIRMHGNDVVYLQPHTKELQQKVAAIAPEILRNFLFVQQRGKALRFAASRGHREIVALLLKPKDPISEEDRGCAVQWAAEAGHGEIVHLLLRQGLISNLQRGLAVQGAAESDSPIIVESLLKHGPILAHHRGSAFYRAARIRSVKVMTLLSENGPIPEQYFDLALRHSAANGDESVIAWLLKRPMTDSIRSQALHDAIKSNHPNVVHLLLKDGHISDQTRHSVFQRASKNGPNSILTLLP